ncbi:MAG: ABC transporter permease [Candidatus Promineifilaceae bacterium]
MSHLLRAELKRSFTMLKRYPSEFLGMFLVIILLFGVLFFGAGYMAGSPALFGDRLDNLIVGYFIWSLAMFSSTSIASEITSEGLVGTIEQVFLSPFQVRTILLIRSLSSLVINLGLSIVVMLILLLITGRTLSFQITILLPFATAILAIYGIAFAIGGLSMIVKKVYQIMPLLQFSLLILIITPVEDWEGIGAILGYLLPITPSIWLLRDILVRGLSPNITLAIACVVNGVLYYVVGLVLFSYTEKRARQKGLIVGY